MHVVLLFVKDLALCQLERFFIVLRRRQAVALFLGRRPIIQLVEKVAFFTLLNELVEPTLDLVLSRDLALAIEHARLFVVSAVRFSLFARSLAGRLGPFPVRLS